MNYLCDLIDDSIKLKDCLNKAAVILDYLFNTSHNNEYLESYINRRWDLYNVMGATKYSIIIGYIFGVTFNIIILGEIWNYVFNLKEIFLYSGVFLIGGILYVLFDFGMERIVREHEDMVEIIIRQIDTCKIKALKRDLGSRAKDYFVNTDN